MSVLIKPIVTEKMSSLNEENKFGFIVKKTANKVEIRKAVEAMFGVNVVNINTIVMPGKPKTRYTKAKVISGRTPSYKKAIVQVADGEFIDFYSSI